MRDGLVGRGKRRCGTVRYITRIVEQRVGGAGKEGDLGKAEEDGEKKTREREREREKRERRERDARESERYGRVLKPVRRGAARTGSYNCLIIIGTNVNIGGTGEADNIACGATWDKGTERGGEGQREREGDGRGENANIACGATPGIETEGEKYERQRDAERGKRRRENRGGKKRGNKNSPKWRAGADPGQGRKMGGGHTDIL